MTVEDEGVTMTVLDPAARRTLVDLVRQALDEHARRAELVEEVRGWLRTPSRAQHPIDGMLRTSLSAWPYPAGAPVLDDPAARPGAGGRRRRRGHHRRAAVDARPTPGATSWWPGMALERMLLHATALDLVASFCDLATQVPLTRARLRGLLPRPGHVQVALRLGRPLVDVRTPPRRPLADVLDVARPPPAALVDLTDPAVDRAAWPGRPRDALAAGSSRSPDVGVTRGEPAAGRARRSARVSCGARGTRRA